jgi:hypothetical protein
LVASVYLSLYIFVWCFLVVGEYSKQDSKLGHENGPTNNFLSLAWNITKLPHRIELDIPKNRMFFVFRYWYILAGKWRVNFGAKKLNSS